MDENENTSNGLLKFITCGSVDGGKSTLIGHMLYDAKLLYTDQEKALQLESRIGNNSGKLDYSLLLDGLMAEREQGITIDVAYRYFSTNRRSFIVADTPGHEQYTRNMAVGASFAELAIILIDATKGIVSQTMRHLRICTLMGIRYLVFAINKMDLLGYSEEAFNQIVKDIKLLGDELETLDVQIIPVSATAGDNITILSSNMPWYCGKVLLEYLETVEIKKIAKNDFIMPVQRVCRPNQNFRGFQGHIESGKIRLGDEVTILPSGERARVKELYAANQLVELAKHGQAVTICLNREIDISRGCVISKNANLKVTKFFCATILWMDDKELVQGREFLIKLASKMVPAVVLNLRYKVDMISGQHFAIKNAKKNDIVICELSLNEDIVCSSYMYERTMGSFILIDRLSNMTSACGRIEYFLCRDDNVKRQVLDITREMRSHHMRQKPFTLWFTGLSGAGKSTIANAVEKELYRLGKYTMLLDGDNIRMGLNCDLGFEERDRAENIRRIAEVSKLMNDAGIIVLTAFISPFLCDRNKARKIIGEDNFIEIYINTSLEECEKRDKKGLYKKARLGEISNFTGVNSPYEPPETPDIVIDTAECSVRQAVSCILEHIL